jgi:hypothetical protein
MNLRVEAIHFIVFLGLNFVFPYCHLEADNEGPTGKYIDHCPRKVKGKNHKLEAVGKDD